LPLKLLVELLKKKAEILHKQCKERCKRFYNANTLKELKKDKKRLQLQVSQLTEKEYGLISQYEERKKERLNDNINTRLTILKMQQDISSLHKVLESLEKKREAAIAEYEEDSLEFPIEYKIPRKVVTRKQVRKHKRVIASAKPEPIEPLTITDKAYLRKELDNLVYENNL